MDNVVSWTTVANFSSIQRAARQTARDLKDVRQEQDRVNASALAGSRIDNQTTASETRNQRARISGEKSLQSALADTVEKVGQARARQRELAEATNEASAAAKDEKAHLSTLTTTLAAHEQAILRAQRAELRLEGSRAKQVLTTKVATKAETEYASAVSKFGAQSGAAQGAQERLLTARSRSAQAARGVRNAEVDLASAMGRVERSMDAVTRVGEHHSGVIHDVGVEWSAASSGGSRLGGIIGRLGGAFDKANQPSMKFGKAMGLMKWPLIIAGVAQLLPVIMSVVASLFSLASAIAPAVGALAALPVVAAGAAVGVGVIVTAFHSVLKTLKQYSAAQQSSVQDAKAFANQQIAAAEAVASAQHGVAEAHYQVAQAAQQAADQITSAQQQVDQATQNELDTRKALNQAYIDARQNLQQLQDQVTSATLAEERSSLSLQQARQNLQQVLDNPASSSLQIADARLAVREAEQAHKQAGQTATQTGTAYDKASMKGVQGADNVVQARRAEQQAIQDITDAQHQQMETQKAAAKSERDAAYQLQMAIQGLADAQRQAAQAADQSQTAGGKYQTMLKKLSPAGQAFVKQVISMRGATHSLSKAIQEATLPGFTSFLKDSTKLFPVIRQVAIGAGRGISDFMDRLGKQMTTPQWIKSFRQVGRAGNSVMTTLGYGFQAFLNILRQLTVAAIPFAKWLANSATAWIKHRDAVLSTTGGYSRFSRWLMGPAKTALTELAHILHNVGSIFYSLGIASSDSGRSILKSIDRITGGWAKFLKSAKGQNELRGYFERARVVFAQVVHLFGELFRWIGKLSQNRGASKFITDMKDAFGPLVKALTQLLTGQLARNLVDIFIQLGRAMEDITGNGAALSGFVDILADFTSALDWFVKVPGVGQAITAIALAFGAFKAVRLLGAITGITGLTRAVRDFVSGARATPGGFGSGLRESEMKNGKPGTPSRSRRIGTVVGTITRGARNRVQARRAPGAGGGQGGGTGGPTIVGGGGSGGLGRRRRRGTVEDPTDSIIQGTNNRLGIGTPPEQQPPAGARRAAAGRGLTRASAGSGIVGAAAGIALLIPGLQKYQGLLMTIMAISEGVSLVTGIMAAAFGTEAVAAEGATVATTQLDVAMDANPIGIITLAIAALAVGLYELITHFKAVSSWLGGPWGTAISAAIAVIMPFIGIPMLIMGHWRQILGFFENLWSNVEGGFTAAWHWVTGTFSGLWHDVTGLITSPIEGAVSIIANVWSAIKSGARDFVHGLGAIWDGIKDVFLTPVGWVIQYVVNPLISAWDWVADKINFGHISKISPGDIGMKHFAEGGIVPGYAPGVDSVPAMLSPGEAVLRPEVTRAIGVGTIKKWNRAAATMGHGGVPGRHYANGGPVRHAGLGDALSGLNPMTYINYIKNKITGPLRSLFNTFGHNAWVDEIAHVPGGMAKALYRAIRDKVKELGSKALGGVTDVTTSVIGSLTGSGGHITVGGGPAGGRGIFGPGGAITMSPDQARSSAHGLLQNPPRPAHGSPLPFFNPAWARGSQWSSLVNLWNGESGWRWNATNPSSGAYGIPQALPGSKMASMGSDWRTDTMTQMIWGLKYIYDRYGNPANAYNRWISREPHWYATGGRVPGQGNRDTVPAMLTPGEFVVRKEAAQRLGHDALTRLNRASGVPRNYPSGVQHLNAGGPVAGYHPHGSSAGIGAIKFEYGLPGWLNSRDWTSTLSDLIRGHKYPQHHSTPTAANARRLLRAIKDPHTSTSEKTYFGLSKMLQWGNDKVAEVFEHWQGWFARNLADSTKTVAVGKPLHGKNRGKTVTIPSSSPSAPGGEGFRNFGRTQSFIRAADAKPYVFGAVGPDAFDCSGLVGEVWARLTGHPSNRRNFTTFNEKPFFRPGADRSAEGFTVGVTNRGGTNHTAGRLGGLKFEARDTAEGIIVGSGAVPPERFDWVGHLQKQKLPVPKNQTGAKLILKDAHGHPLYKDVRKETKLVNPPWHDKAKYHTVWDRLRNAELTKERDIRALQKFYRMKQTGVWSSSMDDPTRHLLEHGMGQVHAADEPHPWSGPVTAAEQALATQDRANALNKEWFTDLSTIAGWGLLDLLGYLEDKGIADGMPIARSAVKDRRTATALDASIKAGKQAIGGINATDQRNVLSAVALLSTGKNPRYPGPIGIRSIATYLQIPDYGVVNLYDKIMSQVKATHVPASKTAQFTKDVKAFRAGLFYAATGGTVPGEGNRDSVPAMLTPGEFVMRKDAASAIGFENLHALNNLQFFASGGVVRELVSASAGGTTSGRPYGAATTTNDSHRDLDLEVNFNYPPDVPSMYALMKGLTTLSATGTFDRAPKRRP